jgi:AraC-like DNA-binding protein
MQRYEIYWLLRYIFLISIISKVMKSHYDEKHIGTFQYGDQNPAIEFIRLPEGENVQILSELHQIIFVDSGGLTVSEEEVLDKKIKEGEFILVPRQTPCVFRVWKEANILVIKLGNHINLYDYLPPDLAADKKKVKVKGNDIGFLKPHQRMTEFSAMLENYINDGIKNVRFLDLKIQEFLILIQAYYDKRQLVSFYAPIHSRDFIFSNNVFVNFDKAKTVKELANTFDYSLSGFEKKFKKIFKISPYKWIQEQKAKKIYYEVSYGPKTFTRIAEEYGFSSPAHFNDFCKQYYGYTPGGLRKKMRAQ